MEYAGAVEVDPPFGAPDRTRVRHAGWQPTRHGGVIRPASHELLDRCLASLRRLVADDAGKRTYAGALAAYDEETGRLAVVTVRDGRVSCRTVRAARLLPRSNVIDLTTRRRQVSRSISGPVA